MGDERRLSSFTRFFRETEPRLRRALIAAVGAEQGREAASEALAYAWEHWERIGDMENPAGYVYRVGRSRAGRFANRGGEFPEPGDDDRLPWVEPGLPEALQQLTERQRTAVMLLHGQDWTLSEIGRLLSISPGSVNKHAERGLAKLRAALEVSLDV